jgi:hypothetical protein
MSKSFTECAPIEKGFAEVFGTRIAPRLSELENRRQALLKTAKRHAGFALAAGAALGLLFATFGTGTQGIGGVIAGFAIPLAFGAVGAFLLWRRQAAKWSGSVARTVMPDVCDFLGDISFDPEAIKGFPLERMQKLGVIRRFSRAEISDRLEGRWRDTPFEIVEAELISTKERRGTSDDRHGTDRSETTLFKGLLMRVGVPEPIPTRILLVRNYGPGNKLMEMFGAAGRDLPKIETGHEAFDRAFTAYAADAETARKVLVPGFLDSFLRIAEAESGRPGAQGLEAGFHDESFFMALERDDDFLAMGRLTVPADEIEDDLHGVFADIATARRIIDRLHGEHPDD